MTEDDSEPSVPDDQDAADDGASESRFGALRERFRRSRGRAADESRSSSGSDDTPNSDSDRDPDPDPNPDPEGGSAGRRSGGLDSDGTDADLEGWVWGSPRERTPDHKNGSDDASASDGKTDRRNTDPGSGDGMGSTPRRSPETAEKTAEENAGSEWLWNRSDRDGDRPASDAPEEASAASGDETAEHGTDPTSELAADADPGSGGDPDIALGADVNLGADARPDSDPEFGADPERDADIDPDSDSESDSDPKFASESDSEPDPGSGSETGSRWERLRSGSTIAEEESDDTPDRPGRHDTETDDPSDASEPANRWARFRREPDDPAPSGRDADPDPGNASIDALDRVVDSARVFALGPSGSPVSEAVCGRFLVGSEGSRNALFVSFDASPIDWQSVCRQADDWSGATVGVIRVGRNRERAPDAERIADEIGAEAVRIRRVSRPGDLSKLGIVATQLLSELDARPNRTVFCVHTLSALHQHVGTKTLFRFLNTLQGRLGSSDVVGYYQMDPELHDEIVLETLRPLFEATVRFSADGDIDVEMG